MTKTSLLRKESKKVKIWGMDFLLPEDRFKVAQALADPLRALILVALAISEINARSRCLPFSGLMKALGLSGDKGRSALSYHLGILTQVKLVSKSTKGIPESPKSYRIYKITQLGERALQEILGYDSNTIVKLAKKYKKPW